MGNFLTKINIYLNTFFAWNIEQRKKKKHIRNFKFSQWIKFVLEKKAYFALMVCPLGGFFKYVHGNIIYSHWLVVTISYSCFMCIFPYSNHNNFACVISFSALIYYYERIVFPSPSPLLPLPRAFLRWIVLWF